MITCAVESSTSETFWRHRTAARPPVEGGQSRCLHRHGWVSGTSGLNSQLSGAVTVCDVAGDVLKSNCRMKSTYTYTYMCLCKNKHTRAHTRAHTRTHAHTRAHTRTHAHAHARTHAHTLFCLPVFTAITIISPTTQVIMYDLDCTF